MANFEVRPGSLVSASGLFGGYSSNLSSLAGRAESVLQSTSGTEIAKVAPALDSAISLIRAQGEGCGRMSSVLSQIADVYRHTEERVTGKSVKILTVKGKDIPGKRGSTSTGQTAGQTDEKKSLKDDLLNLLAYLKGEHKLISKLTGSKENDAVSDFSAYLKGLIEFGGKVFGHEDVKYGDVAKFGEGTMNGIHGLGDLYQVIANYNGYTVDPHVSTFNHYFSVMGGIYGLTGALMELTDSKTREEAVTNTANALSKTFDLAQKTFDAVNNKAGITPAKIYCSIISAFTKSGAQAYNDYKTYSADGDYSIDDIVNTAGRFASTGIYYIDDAMTFGIYGAICELCGTEPTDLWKTTSGWAADAGTWIGNQIVKIKKWKW